MAVSLTTDQDLDRARASVGFCFLCGERFNEFEGAKPLGAQDEHIVPSSILGKGAPGKKPAILWVHPACDANNKQKKDTMLSALQSLHLMDSSEWSQRRVAQVRRLFKRDVQLPDGRYVPSISADSLIDGVRNWVKGFHAILYAEYLPHDAPLFQVFTPSTMFSPVSFCSFSQTTENAIRDSKRFMDESWKVISAALGMGVNIGHVDYVRFWSGEAEYHAIWTDAPERAQASHGVRAMCLWSLKHPGIIEFSRQIGGEERLWHGTYCTLSRPKDAASVDQFPV